MSTGIPADILTEVKYLVMYTVLIINIYSCIHKPMLYTSKKLEICCTLCGRQQILVMSNDLCSL